MLNALNYSVDLSIVIPNFNSGILLDLTLRSIYRTQANFGFEVLVMDNLSSDNPESIIDSFNEQNIYLFSEADFGIYDAMNKGIMQAKGKWLIFLGAGDELYPLHLSELPLESTGLLAIYGNVYLVQSSRVYDGEFSLLKLMKKNISHQAILYHNSVFSLLGPFDTSFKIASDYVFNLNLYFGYREFVKYYPVVISDFLGLGISDTVRDHDFQDRKIWIINKMLFRNFSFSNCIALLKYDIFYLKNYARFKWRRFVN